MRTRNFRVWKEEQSARVKKERKPTLRGKWQSVFSGRHMDNVQKEMLFQSGQTSTRRPVRWRRKGRSSSPAPNSKAKTDEGTEIAQKQQETERKALQTKGAKFRVVAKNCKNPSCNFGIFPCVKTTSLRLDAKREEHVSSDMMRLRRSPARSQRKVVRKDQLHY